MVPPRAAPTPPIEVLEGARLLVIARDVGLASLLAEHLEARGAVVVVSDAEGDGLAAARNLDPEVVLLDPDELGEEGLPMARRLHADLRLRWAPTARCGWARLWPFGRPEPDLEFVAEVIAPLVEPERSFRARVAAEPRLSIELDRIGPNRVLRAVAEAPGTHLLIVRSPGVVAELAVGGGRVQDAVFCHALSEPRRRLGADALAQVLALREGRVEVARRGGEPPATDGIQPATVQVGSADRGRRRRISGARPVVRVADALETRPPGDTEVDPPANETPTRRVVDPHGEPTAPSGLPRPVFASDRTGGAVPMPTVKVFRTPEDREPPKSTPPPVAVWPVIALEDDGSVDEHPAQPGLSAST